MLLSVRDLRSAFFLDEGELWAVDGISFDVEIGETVGLVGESGCGKTIVAHSILDLIPHPGRVVSGQVMFEGRDLMGLTPEQMREVQDVLSPFLRNASHLNGDNPNRKGMALYRLCMAYKEVTGCQP